jgi:hypothetical protein
MAVPSLTSSATAAGRWKRTPGVVARIGRRTLVESLYLLTAPFSAVVGLYAAVRGMLGTRGGRAGRDGRRRAANGESRPRAWLGLAHAVMALPVVFVTSALTALWWFITLATLSFPPAANSSASSRCRTSRQCPANYSRHGSASPRPAAPAGPPTSRGKS